MKMPSVSNIITKGIGIAALGLVVYDSHTHGKIESATYQKQVRASSMNDAYMNTLSQDTPSVVQSKFKKFIFQLRADENISDFFTGIAGYFKGIAKMTISNALPLALATGAIISKGKMSLAFGLGLLGYGAIYTLQNGFGIGKHEEIPG